MEGLTVKPTTKPAPTALFATILAALITLSGGLGAAGAEASSVDAIKNSDNTYKLAKGAVGQAAQIEDLAWLAGYWKGTGLGGETEEMWTPPSGDRMHGVFTLREGGKLNFHESMIFVEKEGTLVLRLKHFDAAFTGWEEKDDTVDFKLVKLGENEAYFNGLTFRRKGDELTIYLVLRRGEEVSEAKFSMKRIEL